LTASLEAEAIIIRDRILKIGNEQLAVDLTREKQFLIDVELWKADCLEE
jgi:hypothetical protein